MGTILVVAEIQKGAIRESSYELVTAAQAVAEGGGHEVNGLVIGSGVGDLASTFASKGAGKTLVVDDAAAVDDHQTANARFLTEAGAAQLMPQTELNPESLAELLRSLLSDRAGLHTMAQNAYRQAKRDATANVADVCEELAV